MLPGISKCTSLDSAVDSILKSLLDDPLTLVAEDMNRMFEPGLVDTFRRRPSLAKARTATSTKLYILDPIRNSEWCRSSNF